MCFVLLCFVSVRAGISSRGGQMAAGVAVEDGYAQGDLGLPNAVKL